MSSSLELEYIHPTPPPKPGVIYASVEHIMLALSYVAGYASKKAIDICADKVKEWLDKQQHTTEVRIFGANGKVVRVVRRKTDEKPQP